MVRDEWVGGCGGLLRRVRPNDGYSRHLYSTNALTSSSVADLAYKSLVRSLVTAAATPRLSLVDGGEDL